MNTEDLERNLEAASRDLRKALPTTKGGVGNENNYSAAYQALVRAGVRPQLRSKYRGK